MAVLRTKEGHGGAVREKHNKLNHKAEPMAATRTAERNVATKNDNSPTAQMITPDGRMIIRLQLIFAYGNAICPRARRGG